MEEKNEELIEIKDMLDNQIRELLDDLSLDRFAGGEDRGYKDKLDKLKVLHEQEMDRRKMELEQQKLDAETALKIRDLELRKVKEEEERALERIKMESDTAIRIRETDLKEENDKKSRELEELKLKEQKRSNTTQAVIGGVTAATGIAGIFATVSCFKKSLRFEETGSFTNKSGQTIGSLFNLFRRKG